jgi:transposase
MMVVTAKILAHVGAVGRFRSAAPFANYTGTAPIEVSSGEMARHRLSRAGNRQLNCCRHVMAITQVRQHTPSRAYYLRKRAEGKSHNEAMRCLKRRLSDLVYRRLIHDAITQRADPGGHSGAALSSRAAG